MKKLLEQAAAWVAWKLPRAVVYHAVIRAWAHATTGPYGMDEAPGVTCSDVVQRWERACNP